MPENNLTPSYWIIANWKMHGDQQTICAFGSALQEATSEPSKNVQIGWCVPSPYLQMATELLHSSSAMIGAQNVHHHENGAFTGEISADMLSDLGVALSLVGHSERRRDCHETESVIIDKIKRLIDKNMHAVLCVGETLAEHEAQRSKEVIASQLIPVLQAFSAEVAPLLIIAYEPVWAIGTGKNATPEQAQSMHLYIRQVLEAHWKADGLTIPIVYGGSVKPENAGDLLKSPDVHGALIGGASLQFQSFWSIVQAGKQVR